MVVQLLAPDIQTTRCVFLLFRNPHDEVQICKKVQHTFLFCLRIEKLACQL